MKQGKLLDYSFLAVAIGVLATVSFHFYGNWKIAHSGLDATQVKTALGDRNESLYEKLGSDIIVLEFGDYQCPPCKSSFNRI